MKKTLLYGSAAVVLAFGVLFAASPAFSQVVSTYVKRAGDFMSGNLSFASGKGICDSTGANCYVPGTGGNIPSATMNNLTVGTVDAGTVSARTDSSAGRFVANATNTNDALLMADGAELQWATAGTKVYGDSGGVMIGASGGANLTFANLSAFSYNLNNLSYVQGASGVNNGVVTIRGSGTTSYLTLGAGGDVTSGNKVIEVCDTISGTAVCNLTITDLGAVDFGSIAAASLPTCNAGTTGQIMYDSTNNKHVGCNGTAWTNLY